MLIDLGKDLGSVVVRAVVVIHGDVADALGDARRFPIEALAQSGSQVVAEGGDAASAWQAGTNESDGNRLRVGHAYHCTTKLLTLRFIPRREDFSRRDGALGAGIGHCELQIADWVV
jgi:hypothetical protein